MKEWPEDSTTAHEHVVAINMGVEWAVGDSGVHLLRSERRTLLAFYPGPSDPAFTDTLADVVGIIEWHGCRGAVLGSPNDEGLHGHRLWEHGLREVGYYNAAEVHGSVWIAEVERVAKAHVRHRPETVLGLRHFILMFHDTTFECIARGYTVTKVTRPLTEVLHDIINRL